ncbi:MAG: LysR family transcriptional regulator [Hyphomicrobiaceae bacterium]|nr:LysR family transcriptional regulator [Hyphomicrobiaceae bacterium]
MKVSLKQLSYFVAAAETGSIADAARLANVAQPSVSWAILKMEELLELELFVRQHAKGVSLTAGGHRLLPQARAILRMIEEFEASARSQAQELTGALHVGCYSTLGAAYLPAIIAEFARRHPRVHIEIHEHTQDEILERLANGTVEVALAFNVDLPDGLIKLRIRSGAPYALLPDGHRLLARESVSLKELKDEPLILLDSTPARQYFLSLFDAAGVKPRIEHTSPSFEVVRGLVSQGLGYSVLITRPLSDVSYDGLRVHPRQISDKVPVLETCTIRAPTSRTTRRSQAFQDICVQLMSNRMDPFRSER